MTESQHMERARRSSNSRGLRIVASVVGLGMLLVVAALLIPQKCAPTIQLLSSGQCGYADHRPAVAIAALAVVAIGGLIAGIGSAERVFPRTFQIGLGIAMAGALLGALTVTHLAFQPPPGTLL